MPIEIISEVSFTVEVEFVREFLRPDRGSGFCFPVTEDGIPLNKNPASAENWARCTADPLPPDLAGLIDCGIQRREWETRHPAIGRCTCGREVTLDAFTCPCDCGRDYNSSGQLLAPRSQWGEETGEHWTECY
jgi:hypothetical protein